MKQLPTQVFTAVAGGGATSYLTAFVPASSWAQQKCLILRGYYLFTIPAGILPPTYNVSEYIDITGAGAIGLATPGAFIPASGNFSSWVEHKLVRMDPVIAYTNLAEAFAFPWFNNNDNQEHVTNLLPAGPPYDYASPITISLQANLPGTIPGAFIQCIWAEAFLEQATNLGKAT
jgi:hypothetical protein